MAITYTKIQVEQVGANLTGDMTNPYQITAKWTAVRVSDGSTMEATTYLSRPTTDPLGQSEWDSLFADATAVFDATAGVTATPVNPVVFP